MADQDPSKQKIRVRFKERMSRSIGQTQDFYDGAVGKAVGLNPPWTQDDEGKPELNPEQEKMQEWAQNRGKAFVRENFLPPIPGTKPATGSPNVPDSDDGCNEDGVYSLPRPWKVAECEDQFMDTNNYLQSRVTTVLEATRMEGDWDDENDYGSAQMEINTLGDLMKVIAHESVAELKQKLTEAGASTYGLVGTIEPNFDAMGAKIWCEWRKVTYEQLILQNIMKETIEDFKAAKKEADEAYEAFDPNVGKLHEVCKEYGRIQECLAPFRRMASISYRKSQMLAREIRSKMKVIKGPLDYGLVKLHERRSSPSPAMDMTGDLGVFMVRKALALYGRQYARCFDFGSKVAAQANRRKAEAEWAVYALNEFLDMRAEHYPPRFDVRNHIAIGNVTPDADGTGPMAVPTPPVKPFVTSEAWKALRDSFLKLREAQAFREIMRGHLFNDADTDSVFKSFPDYDEGDIRSWKLGREYHDKQMLTWSPRTVMVTALKNRKAGKTNIRQRDSFALPEDYLKIEADDADDD